MGDPSDDFLNLHEIAKAARANLSHDHWDYLMGAAESETTMKRNRQALDSIAFRPRVLRGMTGVDCSSTLLGHPMRIPVALAPIGSLETFEAGGGATASRAAAEFGSINFHSSTSSPDLEETAAAADNPKIYCLYVRGDSSWVDDTVRRAIDAGYVAFALTVDSAVYSRRERDLANRFIKKWRAGATGLEYQTALNWDLVKRFKDTHDFPLILKGIATAEDTAIACEHGVDVVYVSNHGGRQLDHGRGAIAVLPEVVAEARGRARVMVDGGFLRGTDVVKAMAFGADAVVIGRLYCMGMAAAGHAGIVRVLELLEEEIRIAMALLGVTTLDQLDPSYVCPALPVDAPHVTSAFPLLEPDDHQY
jgi:glycolate oxidase